MLLICTNCNRQIRCLRTDGSCGIEQNNDKIRHHVDSQCRRNHISYIWYRYLIFLRKLSLITITLYNKDIMIFVTVYQANSIFHRGQALNIIVTTFYSTMHHISLIYLMQVKKGSMADATRFRYFTSPSRLDILQTKRFFFFIECFSGWVKAYGRPLHRVQIIDSLQVQTFYHQIAWGVSYLRENRIQ